MLHDLRAPTEEEEERFEAAGVAQRARAQGRDSSGVLDALEAAEAAHDATHGGLRASRVPEATCQPRCANVTSSCSG